MSATTKAKPLPSQLTPAAAPAVAPPSAPEKPRTFLGDRIALVLWLGCAVLLASLLLKDFVVALFRLLAP
jgi:hypothetical protein